MSKIREQLIRNEGKVFASIFGITAAVVSIIAVTTSDDNYEINFDKPVTVVDLDEEETFRIVDDFYINGTYMGKKEVVKPSMKVKQCDSSDLDLCSTKTIGLSDEQIGQITTGDTIVVSGIIED